MGPGAPGILAPAVAPSDHPPPRRRRRAARGGGLARAVDELRGRLWLWPALAGAAAVAAAELLVRLDRALEDLGDVPLPAFSGGASAARSVLSTIATSTMTVLGVTISLTLAVLALTAQGYSPRVLRRFMRDRGVQAVVATLIGAFAFALVALRQVREDAVPGITISVAVVLALASLAVLVWFFHHLASEIRVERIIGTVWGETREVIEATLTEEHAGGEPPAPEAPVAAEARATRTGRVAWIDEAALAEVARATGATVVVVPAPGDLVAEGEVVARLHGGGEPGGERLAAAVGAVRLATERTLARDVAYGLRQMTDIALRALSPSVNDPTTAEEAVLRSADLLRRISGRALGACVADADGRPLVVRPRPTWEELVGLAFDQVAAEAEAQADAATALVLLDALGRVAAATTDPARLAALRSRAARVRDGARRALAEPRELERVEAAAAALV